MRYLIHTDGGARGNPGIAGAGIVIDDDAGNPLARVARFLGKTTNNVAEYEALIIAFETLLQSVPEHERLQTSVTAVLDSELVVKQLKGEYKIRHPALRHQYARLIPLIRSFGSVTFQHVLRAENREADALANEAMDSAPDG